MLATQCAVAAANSPTRSPSTSPVIHLRRRKTLRMLLGRRTFPESNEFVDRRGSDDDEKDNNGARRKLKDLFVSSSSSPPVDDGGDGGRVIGRGYGGGGGGVGRVRYLPGTLPQRLLRRVWRPVLVTIPE